MTVTGTTNDGKLIVSSWSTDYYIDPSKFTGTVNIPKKDPTTGSILKDSAGNPIMETKTVEGYIIGIDYEVKK